MAIPAFELIVIEEFWWYHDHECTAMCTATFWIVLSHSLFSTGGWGSRKLNMVPPEDSGYTGSLLKNASAGGKTVLYIAPIQEELDPQPLPPDSSSFSNMPKAMCHSCQTSYPLQLLALHVETCQPSDTNAQEVCTVPLHGWVWEITLHVALSYKTT